MSRPKIIRCTGMPGLTLTAKHRGPWATAPRVPNLVDGITIAWRVVYPPSDFATVDRVLGVGSEIWRSITALMDATNLRSCAEILNPVAWFTEQQ